MSSSTPYEQTTIKPGMKEDVQQSLNNIMGVGMGEGTEVQVPQSEGEGGKKERYWGPTPCCVTCVSATFPTEMQNWLKRHNSWCQAICKLRMVRVSVKVS